MAMAKKMANNKYPGNKLNVLKVNQEKFTINNKAIAKYTYSFRFSFLNFRYFEVNMLNPNMIKEMLIEMEILEYNRIGKIEIKIYTAKYTSKMSPPKTPIYEYTKNSVFFFIFGKYE